VRDPRKKRHREGEEDGDRKRKKIKQEPGEEVRGGREGMEGGE
jgi:hypothetical protein